MKMMIAGMKKCRDCFEYKPRDEFARGLISSQYCESCRIGRSQGARQKDRNAKAVEDWPIAHQWLTKPFKHQDQATPRHYCTYRENRVKFEKIPAE